MRAFLENIKGALFLLLTVPLCSLFVIGLFFGDGLSNYLPNWVGWAIIINLAFLGVFYAYQKIISFKKSSESKRLSSLSIVKSPDLDYEGLSEKVKLKRAEKI